jgi:hypothetical protein
MLHLPGFDTKIRGDPRPSSGLQIEILPMNEMHKSDRAQLTYVKTIAEAEFFAAEHGIVYYHSKMSASEQSKALDALAAGIPVVATYGLGVGLNLKVKGKPITSVDIRGMSGFRALIGPW